jgi:hypothetical protein
MIRPTSLTIVTAPALLLMLVCQPARASEHHITGNTSGTFITANFDFDQANESTPAAQIDLQGRLLCLVRSVTA